MVEQSRETPSAHRSGEAVATKLLRIGAKKKRARMIIWGAVCVNCARTVLRGAGTNWRKVEMMWHRRETRRQTEKTKLNLQTGSNLPTHPIGGHSPLR